MEFGRPRAPRPRGPRGRAHLALLALAAALAAIALCSCGAASKAGVTAFGAALTSLDALIASRPLPGLESAFVRAGKAAREASEWLSLLKRAQGAEAAGDAGRFPAIADAARKALPKSESIAATAALAYLRGGRPADALVLFPAPLSPDARPALWAEAFLACRGSAVAKGRDYARLAEISGDARAYLGAAAASLAEGEALVARSWLEKGLAAGVAAPPELLWDCGLYEALAGLSDADAGSATLAIMGDAAWTSGDEALARRRWERSVSLMPRRSWKPYANLALTAGAGEASLSYWERLRAAFLAGPPSSLRDGALGAYAAYLVRLGKEDEAASLLRGSAAGGEAGSDSGQLAAMALAIRGRSQPEERYAVELEQLAIERPSDPAAVGAALRELMIRRRYEELALLVEGATRRKLVLPYGWYYQAAVLAARGQLKPAAALLEGSIPLRGVSAQAGFALGSLYSAMGLAARATEALAAAAAAARDGRERATAYKALGRAQERSGNAGGAARAFASAALADPSDAEAALLARGAAKGSTGGK